MSAEEQALTCARCRGTAKSLGVKLLAAGLADTLISCRLCQRRRSQATSRPYQPCRYCHRPWAAENRNG